MSIKGLSSGQPARHFSGEVWAAVVVDHKGVQIAVAGAPLHGPHIMPPPVRAHHTKPHMLAQDPGDLMPAASS